jgi:hypothetical protein
VKTVSAIVKTQCYQILKSKFSSIWASLGKTYNKLAPTRVSKPTHIVFKQAKFSLTNQIKILWSSGFSLTPCAISRAINIIHLVLYLVLWITFNLCPHIRWNRSSLLCVQMYGATRFRNNKGVKKWMTLWFVFGTQVKEFESCSKYVEVQNLESLRKARSPNTSLWNWTHVASATQLQSLRIKNHCERKTCFNVLLRKYRKPRRVVRQLEETRRESPGMEEISMAIIIVTCTKQY